jgi:putative ABC transport system substrate-binding protein
MDSLGEFCAKLASIGSVAWNLGSLLHRCHSAASFAVQATVAPIHDTSELESIIAAQAQEPNGGLIVMPDTFTTGHRSEITSLAARYHLPAVYPYRVFAETGGLLTYGDVI